MKLNDLIDDKKLLVRNINILGLSEDSREIKKNYIFFLKNTKKEDEKKHILEAIDKGAKVIIYSKNKLIKNTDYIGGCIFYNVPDLDKSMSQLSKAFYKLAENNIKIYGVTGTNGKSTIINLIAQFLKLKKEKCGLIGTMGSGIHPRIKNKGLTTPNIININRSIKKFTDNNVNTIAMEVSSHGIDQNRIRGLSFEAAIFTNLTHDHLDFHKNMNNYFNVKLKLFTEYKNKKKIIFIDNYYGNKIYSLIKNKNKIKTVSLENKNADYYSSNIVYTKSGINFLVNSKYGVKQVSTKLYGEFSVTNILITIATLVNNKADYNFFLDNMRYIESLSGRMQKLEKKQKPIVFIDYAHTPDAVQTALKAMRPHVMGRLIVIVGAGGDRDTTKRPLMGKAATENADVVFVTDDNPRSEDPATIRAAVMDGCSGATEVGDRAEAILRAVDVLGAGDALLIAGKGHETGQTVGDDILPFDDVEQASIAVAALEGRLA